MSVAVGSMFVDGGLVAAVSRSPSVHESETRKVKLLSQEGSKEKQAEI